MSRFVLALGLRIMVDRRADRGSGDWFFFFFGDYVVAISCGCDYYWWFLVAQILVFFFFFPLCGGYFLWLWLVVDLVI